MRIPSFQEPLAVFQATPDPSSQSFGLMFLLIALGLVVFFFFVVFLVFLFKSKNSNKETTESLSSENYDPEKEIVSNAFRKR